MLNVFYKALLVGTAVFVLSACDSSSGGFSRDDTTKNLEDNFGAGFGEIFRADPNSEPRNPTRDDIIAVSFTDDPIDF